MKMINIDESVALNNYLESYDFLANYPKQSVKKNFVDFVNQYIAQTTKKVVLTQYFRQLSNNDKYSIMLSFASYLNKCRIGDYSRVYGSYMSCKIYSDNNHAYYDMVWDINLEILFNHEYDYVLEKISGQYTLLIFINETLYT
jgi:hypothetical protein